MKMKKRKITSLLIVMLVLLYTTNAYAYNPKSYKFPGSYITYSYISGSSYFNNAVTAAASTWSANTDATLAYTSSGGQVLVTEFYNSGAAWDGLSNFTNSGVTLKSCTITINSAKTASYGSYKVRSVVSHEFGHALSLDEYSARVLMHPTTSVRYDSYGIYTPQTDDINGVNYIY